MAITTLMTVEAGALVPALLLTSLHNQFDRGGLVNVSGRAVDASVDGLLAKLGRRWFCIALSDGDGIPDFDGTSFVGPLPRTCFYFEATVNEVKFIGGADGGVSRQRELTLRAHGEVMMGLAGAYMAEGFSDAEPEEESK